MCLVRVCLVALLASLSAAASAQVNPHGASRMENVNSPAMDVGLGYSYFHANAPPSGCGCFSLNGGYGNFVYHFTPQWSAVADFTAAHASNIASTTQNITTFDYFFGPRYSFPTHGKVTYFTQVLVGGAKELSNYAYVQNVNAFGLGAGGGINASLNSRVGWNVVEADWVYTRLPNGVNTHQNLLRVSTGLFLRFGFR